MASNIHYHINQNLGKLTQEEKKNLNSSISHVEMNSLLKIMPWGCTVW